jgi:hypothetical protein
VTRLQFSNGNASKSVAEDLQVLKSHVENLFKLSTHDETALELLDQRPELQGMGDLPDATCIFNASRRLKHAAGGEGGLRAERLRCVCRHRIGRVNLFYDFVVKHARGWWLHGHETEVPHQWGICKTSVLFNKKGDASNPGDHRSIVMLAVTQKLALVIVGDRLQLLVESLGADHEKQNGFCRRRGGADAMFNLRVAVNKRHEHGLEAWVAFPDLIKAFDTISRALLWLVLRRLGAPERFVARLKKLHGRAMVHLRSGEHLKAI